MTTANHLSRLAAATLLLAAVPAGAGAQTLQGRVVDTSTEAPLAGAAVRLLSPSGTVVAHTESADSGAFTLAAPAPGEFVLEVELAGHQTAVLGPLQLRAREQLELTVALGAAASPAEGARLPGGTRSELLERAGFYERRAQGVGQFLDRTEIGRLRPAGIVELLETFRGVRVIRTGGALELLTRAPVAAAPALPCRPRVFVDDEPVLPSAPGAPDLAALPTDRIEAIEVYVGALTVPRRFRDDAAACGAVAIWRAP